MSKLTHEQYKEKFCNWKSRTQENSIYWYQCTAQVKHYCKLVRWYTVGRFWGTAIRWRVNRKSTFQFKKSISWFSLVPVWSVVIFKQYAIVETKKPWTDEWKKIKLGVEGHVAIVDYIDNDGVIRVIEQNGATGDGDGKWWDEIRVRGYKWKDSVAWFILQ